MLLLDVRGILQILEFGRELSADRRSTRQLAPRAHAVRHNTSLLHIAMIQRISIAADDVYRAML